MVDRILEVCLADASLPFVVDGEAQNLLRLLSGGGHHLIVVAPMVSKKRFHSGASNWEGRHLGEVRGELVAGAHVGGTREVVIVKVAS